MNEVKTGTIEAFEPDMIISRDLTLSVYSRNRFFFQSLMNKTIIQIKIDTIDTYPYSSVYFFLYVLETVLLNTSISVQQHNMSIRNIV